MAPLIFFTTLFIMSCLLYLLVKNKKKGTPRPHHMHLPRRIEQETKSIGGELETIFSTFDSDGDGFITIAELEESLRRLNLSATLEEVKSMLERVDADEDGLIDIEEFRELYESLERAREGEVDVELREAFEVFDGNGDGKITREELRSVLVAMGLKQGERDEDCRDMIERVDLDGDGKVDFEEFKKMMRAKLPAGGKLF